MQTLLALLFGFAFGFLLQRAGLSRYKNIVNVFLLKDMTVLKFMMSAMATGMVGIFLFRDLGLLELQVNETYVVGNLLGGAIFGIGMALAGFCPGTVVAGAGQGSLDYLLPGMLGFLGGAVLFGATYTQVFRPVHAMANLGGPTLASLWNVQPWLVILLFVQASVGLFLFLEAKKL
ncbi:YeeE/YedE thiosulfate transporter family protein [Limnochorda pilosa]|uniref:Sulphur transport domain-containing protein n=1 Tax=Limnochorda pilosa TaxID=1555112 RepID=A0A0K2SK44_LIMPI|nr:YeeE/YedE thiosulfate transporter family protein [Limnochorda pilosa]BAS27199.1 hypothetical protein LIP_1348 [Limnochorda pilosa]